MTAKVQKLNQKIHCSARGRHAACSSCAIATRWRRHTVSKNYFVPVLTLLVCLFLRHGDAAPMRSTTKKISEITRAPREVCRSGHCAQPSIHQLATAVDPATADGGAAAAAGGPGAHPALGCCRRPGRCWRPGRRRRCHSCARRCRHDAARCRCGDCTSCTSSPTGGSARAGCWNDRANTTNTTSPGRRTRPRASRRQYPARSARGRYDAFASCR